MPSTVGLPSASTLSHIISGSQPARRCMPVSDSNSAWRRLRFPRQSEVRKAPPSTSSSRPRNSVQKIARRLGVPGQDAERLGLGDADQLARLGSVADVVALAVDEQVRRRPVDELEALVRDVLPVRRRDALAHDATRDGDELVVHVLDAGGVDLLADLLDRLVPALLADERFDVGRHRRLPSGEGGPISATGGRNLSHRPFEAPADPRDEHARRPARSSYPPANDRTGRWRLA